MMMDLQHQQHSGLLPDFAIVKDGRVVPAPPGYLEGDRDGSYAYNACRIPWRLASDVSNHQDARAQAVLDKLAGSLLALSHHQPSRLLDGYKLDGSPIGAKTDRLAFLAPMAVALTTLPQWQNEAPLWWQTAFVSRREAQGYYNETLQVLGAMKAGY
jgi:hypothetical protein